MFKHLPNFIYYVLITLIGRIVQMYLFIMEYFNESQFVESSRTNEGNFFLGR